MNELDELIEKTERLLNGLRALRDGTPCRDNAGLGDRVKAQVVGPDGEIKQEIQT